MFNISYFYNKEGIRTKKVVNNTETNYFLENSNIIFEETNGNRLYYLRTGENELLGFIYNGEKYYYKKNYQGDIFGIYNQDYKLIATYEYDSWGKILSIKDNNGAYITDSNHIAIINPFRYHSYYYDSETNLYYLNSRYYNPEWGRFLNADGIINANQDLLGFNLYIYVNNCPIKSCDNGMSIFSAIKNTVKNALKTVVQKITQKVSTNIGKTTNLPISASMLNSALNNSTLTNDTKKKLTNKIKNSSEMKNEINNCISSNKNKNTFTCTGSIKINSDTDLKLSVGKTNYKIEGKTELINNLTYIQTTVFDTYNFDEKRKWNSLTNAANNFGYYYQNLGLLTPYKWDIFYETIIFNEEN